MEADQPIHEENQQEISPGHNDDYMAVQPDHNDQEDHDVMGGHPLEDKDLHASLEQH